MRTLERTVPVMGSAGHIVIVGGSAELLDQAVAELQELEQKWSRFLPGSEVSRFNRAGDSLPLFELSSETQLLFELAEEGRRLTTGRFNPWLLDAVVEAGYSSSFDPRSATFTAAGTESEPGSARGFDPGGIGKGLAADLVSATLIDHGARGAMVSVGGDLRVRGRSPNGNAWRVEIEDPREGSVCIVELAEGGVATSSRMKRRWTGPTGLPQHHLIEPTTRHPSDSPVMSATVIAADAWRAEVLCKVAFLDSHGQHALGDDAGLELVEQLGAAALVVTPDLLVTTSQWDRFEVAAQRTSAVSWEVAS